MNLDTNYQMKHYKDGQVFDRDSTEIPECPVCKKGTERVHLDSEQTTMGDLMVRDRLGNVTSIDRNIKISRYGCKECSALYKVKTQCGEQLGETILLN